MRVYICTTYLRGEALDQDGDEQVEEHVVAKGHEGHEVESCPVRRLLHAVEQHHVPVLLREDLWTQTHTRVPSAPEGT